MTSSRGREDDGPWPPAVAVVVLELPDDVIASRTNVDDVGDDDGGEEEEEKARKGGGEEGGEDGEEEEEGRGTWIAARAAIT